MKLLLLACLVSSAMSKYFLVKTGRHHGNDLHRRRMGEEAGADYSDGGTITSVSGTNYDDKTGQRRIYVGGEAEMDYTMGEEAGADYSDDGTITSESGTDYGYYDGARTAQFSLLQLMHFLEEEFNIFISDEDKGDDELLYSRDSPAWTIFKDPRLVDLAKRLVNAAEEAKRTQPERYNKNIGRFKKCKIDIENHLNLARAVIDNGVLPQDATLEDVNRIFGRFLDAKKILPPPPPGVH